ncbi:hypothetical protein BH11BAC1_BH11BAC1_01210 [soil metagenome]
MKQNLLALFTAAIFSIPAFSQCTTSNAIGCVCPGGGSNCDLLPDIKVSVDAVQNSYVVYTQSGNAASGSQGSNDGRLRLSGTTPNIGYGPLETRSINKWLCGTDTLITDPGTLCTDGTVPKRFVVQRIYHKNGGVMSYTDVPCGTMTYHPSHGHMHVDNWGIYTLRLQNPNDPDPTHWSIVGTGTKLAFCLLDIAGCDNGNGIYCRSDNNTPQMTAQIPNNTIGAGNYGCSSTLQGISNGWYDSYNSGLDGMWIDVPAGTCNGTYYIVVQIDPNQNMVELNENNNVIAVPVTISNQSAAGSPVTKISANKAGAIVPGENVILTATAGSSYLWSPGGGTTQSITVSSAGSYTCTVTNYCGTATSAPFVVTLLPAATIPVSGGATICSGAAANLTATNGGTGTMKWYNTAVATIPLATGSSYPTPNLTGNTTYYVENEVTTTGTTVHVGPVDNTIGGGSYQTSLPTYSWYSQFDALSNITLVSVKVFASTTGNRTFILQDRASTQLKSVSINIPAIGANVITLNWYIPAGAGYKLLVSGTPNLYYNTSGVSYPYTVTGICSIFGSYSGHSNYTFFYDMVVRSADKVAKSGRIPVAVTVNPLPTVSFSGLNTSYSSNASAVTLTGSPAGGNFSGPGINGNQFNPATAGVGGPYNIVYSYTNGQGCTNAQTRQVTVTTPTVNCLLPNNLSASNIQNTSAQVNWANATADTFLVRYAVHNTTNFNWKKINGQPNVVSTVLTGLLPGTQYDWWVRSLCISITSSGYQAVPGVFTTLNTAVACITPFNLNATAITNVGSTISWTNSVSADTFRVRYSVNGTTNFAWKDVNGSGAHNTSLTGLTPGTTYQFQVSSKCVGVTSAYSTSFLFTTLSNPVACIIPYGLSASNVTSTSASVHWTNLVAADTFRVRYAVNGTTNFFWKDVSGIGGTTTAPLTGLAASTNYQWSVRSMCTGMGTSSSYSAPANFITLAARVASTNEGGMLHDVIIYPNPAHAIATLQFTADKEDEGTLYLYDVAGREIKSKSYHVAEGKNGIEIDLSYLPQGIYLVILKSSTNSIARVNLVVE